MNWRVGSSFSCRYLLHCFTLVRSIMKNARVGRWFGFLAMGLLVAVGFGAGKTPEEIAKEGYWGKDDTWVEHSKLLGKPAPALELSDWHGTPVKAADMKDKIGVVDFWATWGGPCKRAVPHNNELGKKKAEKGETRVGACGERPG